MNKKLIAPICIMAGTLALGVGSTWALFTSKASSKVEINSGTVKVNYSSTLDTAESRYLDEEPFDAIAAASGTEFDAVFENGGTASINDGDSTVITLDRLTPMDRISLTTKAFNGSNVNIKYRYYVKLDGELIPALQILIDGTDYSTDSEHYEIKSVWSDVVTPSVEGLFQKDVKIAFPSGGEEQNAYQNKSCTIEIGIEAIQGNAYVVNEQTNPEIPLSETIYSAKPSDVDKAADMQNSNGTVRAQIQGSSVDDEADKLTFNINRMNDCHESTPIDDSNNYVALDLEIEEIKADNITPIQMSVDIGLNKKNVKVFHEGEQITAATYTEDTGIVAWETLSCSQFDITWEICLVNNYEELSAAIEDCAEYIRFGSDIVDVPNTSSVVVGCSTEIDGNGHKLSHTGSKSSGNHAVVEVGSNDLDIKFTNLEIINETYSGICNRYSNVNLSLEACTINSWFNVVFLHQRNGAYHSENSTLTIVDCTFVLDQTVSGETNGALCLQINGYNQKVNIINSVFNVSTTTDSAESAVIGGSNYGGSKMGNCEFYLLNCECNFVGDSNWFYYFDVDEEDDTNNVVAEACEFNKAEGGYSLFTNAYAFNYPVKYDHCLFSFDVSTVTETEGTHPTPLHFVRNSDGTWSN